MKLKKSQFDAQLRFLGASLAGLTLAASAHADFAQTSADYTFTAESIDGGGQPASSADYISDGSLSTGNFATSSNYILRGGYIGQLNNPPILPTYTVYRQPDHGVQVPLDALLASASDPEGDAIFFLSFDSVIVQGANVTEVGDQYLQYTPPPGYNGDDTIFWSALDAEGDEAVGSILVRVITAADEGPTLQLISRQVSGISASLVLGGFSPMLEGLEVGVQYTDRLTPPINWQYLGSAPVTNGLLMIVDPTGNDGSNERFYRTIFPAP